MAARGSASPRWLSWTGLVYYGETVGFLFAWIAGLTALVYSASAPTPVKPDVERVAAADLAAPSR